MPRKPNRLKPAKVNHSGLLAPKSSPRSKNKLGSELLDAACAEWPSLPSRTLARKLFNENKGVWSSIDSVRQSVLYRRGRNRTKSYIGKGIFGATPSTAPSVPWNPEGLPPSDEKDFVPHVVDVDRDTRALVLGDIHVPYHNLAALSATLERGRRNEAGLIFINGDLLDFHRLSRFQKDPRARDAKSEIQRTNQLLDFIDDRFPKARKILKAGNHDERYDNYIAAHAPEIFQLVKELCSLEKLLELDERGWEYVAEKRPVMLGKLPVIHGHEYPTPVIGPVNAARGLFLRAKACAMVNHHHQTSEHTETTIHGEMITTWSLGCLCELHPMYARFNKWNHGAAEVEIARNGDFQVHNFRISNGKVLN